MQSFYFILIILISVLILIGLNIDKRSTYTKIEKFVGVVKNRDLDYNGYNTFVQVRGIDNIVTFKGKQYYYGLRIGEIVPVYKYTKCIKGSKKIISVTYEAEEKEINV